MRLAVVRPVLLPLVHNRSASPFEITTKPSVHETVDEDRFVFRLHRLVRPLISLSSVVTSSRLLVTKLKHPCNSNERVSNWPGRQFFHRQTEDPGGRASFAAAMLLGTIALLIPASHLVAQVPLAKPQNVCDDPLSVACNPVQTKAAPATADGQVYVDTSDKLRPVGQPDRPKPSAPEALTDFQRLAQSSTGEALPIFGRELFQSAPSTFAPGRPDRCGTRLRHWPGRRYTAENLGTR